VKKAEKTDAKPAVPGEYVTLVVTDQDGRRLTRTMRRSDQLQVLMDFYYSMVPTVKQGEGVFNYRGPEISRAGSKTPADFQMKDGDEIRFFPKVELVTPVLQDFTGRSFTRTMRTTDRLQVLMNFYHAMVPAAGVAPGVFMYCGEHVTGEQTPAGIGMKDWDRIYVVPTVRGEVGREKKSDDDYITLTVREAGYERQAMVHLTLRQTEKVRVLMRFYYDIMPAACQVGGVFFFDGTRLSGEVTPSQIGMEDGDEVDHFATQFGVF
jgi:small ubiquitin-related modifier